MIVAKFLLKISSIVETQLNSLGYYRWSMVIRLTWRRLALNINH